MPTVLQITDGTLTVDLATDTDWKASQNWLPIFTSPAGDGTIPPDITESIPVLIRITSEDDYASSLADLAQLARYAAEYTAGNQQDPVWFYTQIGDETGQTRTLVRSLRFTADARFGGPYDDPPCIEEGRTGVLTITHHPYHERTAAVAASGTAGISLLGGAVNYTDVAGDVNARLFWLSIDAGNFIYREFWIGFRSDRRAEGDAGNVAPLWELEDGTTGTDTVVAADATASPGGGGNTKMRCTFVTLTWADRCYVRMADVTANEGNQTGAFVVLLRAKVDQGSADVRLHVDGISTEVTVQNQAISVDATAWTIYNLGTVEWPYRDLQAAPYGEPFADSYGSQVRLRVWARTTPGATAPTWLDLDCLILIPADEYFLHVKEADLDTTGGIDAQIYIQVGPNDIHTALTVDETNNWTRTVSPLSVIGSGVPEGDGRAFVCGAGANSSAPGITLTADVQLRTFPRYVHFRGAD
jgi:hypothetical protein